MKVGDMVKWSKGYCEIPGLVLETRPTKYGHPVGAGGDTFYGPGTAVLAMLPELPEPEWFHEKELEVISESR
jgi:hypothetical protein